MTSRLELDRADVKQYMPDNTEQLTVAGREVYLFSKSTDWNIFFRIAIFYDPDERGYCAQLFGPKIDLKWMNPHVGHIFSDGVICFGGDSMRTRKTLREAYAKSCLWAEGMAVMLHGQLSGRPTSFPFSINSKETDIF